MNARAFAMTREEMACGGCCDALGSAQIPELLVGEGVAEDEATRTVRLVTLGKRSIRFRSGFDARERREAVHELTDILKAAKGRARRPRVPFGMKYVECIAAVAIDELARCACPTCNGAGEVRQTEQELLGRQPTKVCPTCMGNKRRKFTEDDRVSRLAREWIARTASPEERKDPDLPAAVARTIRGHTRLRALIESIEYGVTRLLEAERTAVEQTAKMLERWPS